MAPPLRLKRVHRSGFTALMNVQHLFLDTASEVLFNKKVFIPVGYRLGGKCCHPEYGKGRVSRRR